MEPPRKDLMTRMKSWKVGKLEGRRVAAAKRIQGFYRKHLLRCQARVGSSKKFKVTNDTLALTSALLAASFFSATPLHAREKQHFITLEDSNPSAKVDILANTAVQHMPPLSSAMQELLLLRGSPYEMELPTKDKGRLLHDDFVNMMSEAWLLCSTEERLSIHKQPPKRAAFYLRALGPLFSDLFFIFRGGPILPHIRQMNAGSPSTKHLAAITDHIQSLYPTHPTWSDSLDGLTAKVRKVFWLLRSEMSMSAIQSLGWLLSKLWRVLFDGVFIDMASVDAIQALVASVGPNVSLVLAPTHKSHLDYLLVSYVCFAYGLPLPRIAAGINLNLPLVGSYLRANGSFFIRRSYHGDGLYKEILTSYVHELLQDGSPIEVFVEGGRSRHGRVMKPKVGFFHMMASFLACRPTQDILVVPLSIDYDRVLEVPDYAGQLLGQPKQKESIWSLVKSLASLGRCGNAYIRLGSPLPMQHHIEHFGLDAFAARVARGMQAASTVTASALVAAVLLWKRHHIVLTRDQLEDDVAWLVALVRSRGAVVAPFESTADLVAHAVSVLQVPTSSDGRLVHPPLAEDDAVRVLTLAFYRNHLLHVFLPRATLASVVSSRLEHGASLSVSAIVADARKLWAYCARLCPHASVDWTHEVVGLCKELPFVHEHPDRPLGIEVHRWQASPHVGFLTSLLNPFLSALDAVASAVSLPTEPLTELDVVRRVRSYPTEFAEARSAESVKQALATLVEYGAVTRSTDDHRMHTYVAATSEVGTTRVMIRHLQRRRRKVWERKGCPAHAPLNHLQVANLWLGQSRRRIKC
ncbi:hypothetical protein H257_00985 [Aphanomyces astaci]|uniref:Phospholipid/glycerol acyltransferase domain-containing protein n=1 Tax=Aphanomyces astaci TaxID=112090 RepID=W4H8E1_APHAT|nr:hypothetical protein H257_00985 [Aphanomyces astaci]ETV87388.1 hypothetical protein H257_00985 [Aphanomyces astaci]|eukprot:XP_009822251.1 hypothetical protein H257_00985 [Aphanomyces astaci]